MTLFDPIPEDSTLYLGLFNPWLVGAAVCVAVIGYFAVFSALHFSRSKGSVIRSPWLFKTLLGGALGVCVWIMHFIGMIAYILPVPVAYDPWMTAISILPVLLAGTVAFQWVAPNDQDVKWHQPVLAGLSLAAGMLGTHALGLNAIDLAGMVRMDGQDTWIWAAEAAVLAIVVMALPSALQKIFKGHRNLTTALSALLGGGLLYLVHRIGIESTNFLTNVLSDMVIEGYDPEWLAAVVLGIAALLGTIVWLAFIRSFLRQIERSNLLLNQALDLTRSGFWEYEHENHRLLLSEQSARILGVTSGADRRNAGLSMSLADWVRGIAWADESAAAHSQSQMTRLAQGQENIVKWTFPYRPQPGQPILWLSTVGTAVSNPTSGATQCYFAVQDVTDEYALKEELKRSKENADAANKTKGEFLANMSHEIRTPMNAILGLTELALRQPMTPKLNDQLGKVQLAAKNLLGIINDILDLSKVESGKMELEITDFNLDDVLDNLSTVLSTSIEEKGLELLFDRRPDVAIRLKGDPLRLGQVLLNLCGNARKFTDQGSIVVRVSCTHQQADHQTLLFEIVDSGIGMTPEQVDKLFKPFSQADASTTRKYGGTGLGLAISKQLVELMGGRIGVKSTPGIGSTFYFEVPFEVNGVKSTSQLLIPELEGMRVLVVDDNPQARDILAAHLTHFSCRAEACESADLAMPLIAAADQAAQPYRLVLMDFRMSGTDGLSASARIKHDMGLQQVPAIVLVTAASHFDGFDEPSIRKAVDEVLNKPVNASMLFDAIMNVMGFESAVTHKPAQRSKSELGDMSRIQGARILLVEDNPINQEVANEFLTQMGLHVTIANHGQEALDVMAQSSFDLVLMDVQMPVMDGYTATRHIREHLPWQTLPVVAMTANVMAEDKKMAQEAGMNDHVAKPIVMADLQAVLLRWIQPRTSATPINSAQPVPTGEEQDMVVLPLSTEALDVQGALAMLNGNSKLLRKLLLDFVNSHALDAQHMDTAIEQGKTTDAERLAHTLKGVAGMLGARRLQQSSLALEQAFRAKEEVPPLALRQQWGDDLEQVVVQLRDWQSGLDQSAPKMASIDPETKQALVRQLRLRLTEFDPEAAELAQTLCGHAMEPEKTRWQQLQEQAEAFDFEGALSTLNELGVAE